DQIESNWPSRVWNGKNFEGQRVLIRCVHGLGDTIQFIRYAMELKRVGAISVVAQMHPELVVLVSTAPGLDSAITWGPRPEFDTGSEVRELRGAFRTPAGVVPENVPYLFRVEDLVVARARRFGQGKELRVALIWTSSTWDDTRSAPLDAFESALADIPEATF